MSEAAPEALRAPASPGAMFRAFNRLALQGFGGVLPVAQREIVERERWLSREQFVELLAIGQVLPGPNVVNLAVLIGDRFFGWRGIAAAVGGLLLAPLAIVLALAALYAQFASQPAVAGALRGMGAAAAGLVLGTAWKLAPALSRNPLGRWPAAALALAAFAAMALLRWPLLAVVAGLGSAACAAAAWRLRTRR